MESLREDNLQAACKRQNRVGTYRESIARWHEAGVVCHVGFIIGFPFDTYDRIMEDVRTLRDELLVDQASFFMLTPLPGSRDHRAAVEAGLPMDADYNNFDSFRPAMRHPLMSAGEWTAAYRDAWTTFYSADHMRRALLRQNPHTYWGMFKCFLWYRASMVEGTHPMVTGFFRLKDRRSRRPGWPVEGRWRFLRRRAAGHGDRSSLGYAKLLLEMQELWLATRIRHEEYAFVGDLRALKTRATAMLDVKTNWARAHTVLAARLRDWRTSTGAPGRACQRGHVTSASKPSGGPWDSARTSWRTRPRPRCPTCACRACRRSALARGSAGWPGASTCVRTPSLEARRALTAYWRLTAHRLRHWQVWRLNPLRARLERGARCEEPADLRRGHDAGAPLACGCRDPIGSARSLTIV